MESVMLKENNNAQKYQKHLTGGLGVEGSNPFAPTKENSHLA
jgi:hypothetical protein